MHTYKMFKFCLNFKCLNLAIKIFSNRVKYDLRATQFMQVRKFKISVIIMYDLK